MERISKNLFMRRKCGAGCLLAFPTEELVEQRLQLPGIEFIPPSWVRWMLSGPKMPAFKVPSEFSNVGGEIEHMDLGVRIKLQCIQSGVGFLISS